MIKKIIYIYLILIPGLFLNAQPVAKSLFIGGNIGLNFQKVKIDDRDQKENYTKIQIMPKVGYFLTERTAIGLGAGINSLIQKRERLGDERKRSETTFQLSPFVRYYLTSGTVGFFTEGSFNIGLGQTKETRNEDIEKGNITQISLGISPGIYLEIHPKITLEFSAGWLGYQYESRELAGTTRSYNRIGFDLGTTGLSLGATIKL